MSGFQGSLVLFLFKAEEYSVVYYILSVHQLMNI